MLDRFTWIMEGLVVYPERMRLNLSLSHNLFFSHRLLLALVEAGLPRGEAYRIVQGSSMRAWDENLDFCELVREDPRVTSQLSGEQLDGVFDLASTVKHVDVAFARLEQLTDERGTN
jgi:adenylosuccinate lyase